MLQTALPWAFMMLLTALQGACALPTPPATQPREVSVTAAKCQQASYPVEARRWQAAGSTDLEFEVNPEGKVTRVAILKPSGTTPGHQALDALARESIVKCEFGASPGKLSGIGRMSYLWKLE